MKNFIHHPFWTFGSKQPMFYLGSCEACGFRQRYETGTMSTIVCDESEADDSIIQVDKVPDRCPVCGAKLTVKKLQKVILY